MLSANTWIINKKIAQIIDSTDKDKLFLLQINIAYYWALFDYLQAKLRIKYW